MSDDLIITNNLETAFQQAKNNTVVNRNLNRSAGLTKTSIIEKNALPKRIQKKMGNYGGMGMGLNANGVNVRMGNPTFYHPLFQTTNMYLPRDRRERNEWCRHFYRTEPIIATALDMHTEFPISDFNHLCSDKSIKNFFDYMAFDRLDMLNLLLDIGLEYWKIGDVFIFGQLNEDEGMWDKFTIMNPDFMDIQASIFAEEPVIELMPDAQLEAIVNSGPHGEWASIYNQIPDTIVRQVKMGKNISLDNRLISHIAHKASQYETWGTPLMMRCFKTLIYKDKLRQAQDAIANRHIFPFRVAKIGMPGEPMPSQDDLDNFRDMLMEADGDPSMFIVYHYGVQLQFEGANGKILPLNQEFDFIQKELMNGLGVNEALLNGDGPTYANAQVGMDALAKRYMSYRERLESWMKRKVYRPIAEVQGFYKSKNGEIAAKHMSDKQRRISAARKDMELIVPDIIWQHQDLTSNQSIMNLLSGLQGKGLVSMSTLLPIINLDPETEKKNLEAERGTVFDPNAPKTGPLPSEGGALGTSSGTPGGGSAPKVKSTPTDTENAPTPPPGGKSSPSPSPSPSPSDNGGGGKANPEDFGFPKQTSVNDFFVKNGVEEVSTPHRLPKIRHNQ